MAHRFDFAVIRERVTPEMVLAHYSLEARTQGKNLRTVCPFHGHSGKPDPGDLSVDAEWRFQCFSCKAKGRGALKFVELTENVDTKEAAERIYGWFGLGNGNGHAVAPKANSSTVPVVESQSAEPAPLVNIPLREKAKAAGKDWDGRLKLDHAHPYLAERGFDPKLCEEYQVGFAKAGKMAGRIAFQIRNVEGEIVAYCGRAVGDLEPRWKQADGFHKSLELYNLDRVLKDDFDEVFLCESFWAPLAFARIGVKNCVALMGKEMSEQQAKLLGHFRKVTLMLDANARVESHKVGAQLLAMNFDEVRVLFLPDEDGWRQPDQLTPEDLYSII